VEESQGGQEAVSQLFWKDANIIHAPSSLPSHRDSISARCACSRCIRRPRTRGEGPSGRTAWRRPAHHACIAHRAFKTRFRLRDIKPPLQTRGSTKVEIKVRRICAEIVADYLNPAVQICKVEWRSGRSVQCEVPTGNIVSSECPNCSVSRYGTGNAAKYNRSVDVVGYSSCPAGSNWNFYSWRGGGDGGCQLCGPE
jgi:hypothetical protein